MAAPFDPAPYAALGSAQAGAAVPEAPVRLSLDWFDVSYSLPGEKGRRAILEAVSGRAEAGQLLALMGPSGSGKTSLLNALAGRMPLAPAGSRLEGEVLVGTDERWLFGAGGKVAVPVSRLDMASVAAYVEQDDALFALSTVQETLAMMATLRMPRDPLRRAQRVARVMADLGLSHIKDTVVGSDLPGQRGISGGERKRLNIACELLHEPRLVFADEPTTGLDSFQALSVMEALKRLAQKGHTVIVSIHQPRSAIYNLVDEVMLLSSGRTAYVGPAGEACAGFFERAGYPVPVSFNPADHILDVVSVDQRSSEEMERSQGRLKVLLEQCAREQEGARRPEVIQAHEAVPEPLRQRQRGAGCSVAFGLLLRRTWRELMRDKAALGVKTFMQLIFTILFGTVYYQMDMSQKSLQNRTGILFFGAMNQAFASIIGCSQLIPRQLKVVQRERANRLYGMLPFYVANMLTQLPIETLPGILWGVIVYLMTALRPGYEHMATYIGLLALENLVGIGLGMVISASVSTVEMAPQVAPAFVILFVMFSGFLLNQDSIPWIFTPLKHISFVRYTFQALAVNELRGNKGFDCKEKVFGPVCLQGDDWLKQLGFEDVSIRTNVLILLLELLVFNVVAFTVLVGKRPAFLRMQRRRQLP